MNPLLFLVIVSVVSIFYQWIMRKFTASIQRRIGPLKIMQPFTDLVKMLFKEDAAKERASLMFCCAPVIALMVTIFSLLLFNLEPTSPISGYSLVILGALLIIEPVFYLLAEISARSPYVIVGGRRHLSVSLMIAVPLILSLIAVVAAGDSYSLTEIGKSWNIYRIPLAFFTLLICSLAQLSWPPFDAPEASQEIVGGLLTEYSGKKMALWKLNSYYKLVLVAFTTTALFLGGGSISVLILKASIIVAVFSYIKATSGRWRLDQMKSIVWKAGTIIALVQLLILWWPRI